MATLTTAPAQGGLLEATWFSTSLAKLVPAPFVILGDVANGLGLALPPLQVALNAVAVAQQAAAILPEVPNAAVIALNAAVNLVIQTVIDQVNNLRNTGESLIVLPPNPGGFQATSRVIRQALLNTRDPQRPNFAPGATVAGWGIIAAADIKTIQNLVTAFNALFTASDKLAAQSNTVIAKASLNFPDPFAAQKLAGRPAPQNTPSWLRVRVVDLIPGADDVFDNLVGALKSLQSPLPTLPILDYLDFLNRIIARIQAVLVFVVTLINLLRALFIDIPVKIIEFDAQFGSTQDIADSLASWFNPSQQILSDVPPDLYTCGVFSVIGSADPFSPGLEFDLLRTLILP